MTTRLDLKCGNGAISPGEKCHKGNTSRARTAAKVALGAGIGAAALATPSFMSGQRTGHLTHGHKANPGMAGGLANAAVPAVVGALAGGALTAGAVALRGRSAKSSVSQGLEKGTTKQLNQHRQALLDELVKKYDKPITNQRELDAFDKWASRQALFKEVEAVNKILKQRRSSRNDAGKRCGQGYIASGKQCQQKGAFPTRKAIAVGLAGAGLTAGAIALHRRRTRITPVGVNIAGPVGLLRGSSPTPRAALPGDRTTRVLPGDRTTRRITGTTPYGLLPPRPPKSKTQRLRENTQAAIRGAERDMGRAARAEITRAGAVGNAMFSAGEATGMATKTTMRELRLRVEAARRRFEPGYRRGRPAASRPQPQLPEGGSRFQVPFNPPAPRRPAPDGIPIDPRPRRQRRTRGRTDNYIPVYAPVRLSRIQ